MSAKRDERRRSERRRCRVQVKFWNDELEGLGFTGDISNRGLFIETTQALAVGTRLHLEIKLETGTFYAEGVVARLLKVPRSVQSVMKRGLGVRILDLTEVIRKVSTPEIPGSGLEIDLRDLSKLATVYVRDIKRGGLFVPTEKPPERDTTVTVRLHLPEPHGHVDVRGVVIHVMENPPGIGIKLLDMDQLRGKLALIITS